MGQYIIPGAGFADVPSLVHHVESTGLVHPEMTWDFEAEGGVLFVDPTRTDQQCADLYATWQHVDNWRPPLPDPVLTHLQHLRDYVAKDPAAITNAESVHVIKDLIRAVHFLNSRLESEG